MKISRFILFCTVIIYSIMCGYSISDAKTSKDYPVSAMVNNTNARLPDKLEEKLINFTTDLKNRNTGGLIAYFHPHHYKEFISINEKYNTTSDPGFINDYIIYTFSLYGKNKIKHINDISSFRYTSITNEGRDHYMVHFKALVKGGRVVHGWFFIIKKTLEFSGPYG